MPSAPTAPTAVLPPWQQTCSTCPASGRSCSVLNHPYLVLPGDAQCSHSSHSSLSSSQAARSGHSFRTAAANRPHQQQQGDLGGKCSQAASNGHHFSPAQYCPVLTYPGHPPTTAAATSTTGSPPPAAGSASNSSVRRLQQQCEESSTPTAV